MGTSSTLAVSHCRDGATALMRGLHGVNGVGGGLILKDEKPREGGIIVEKRRVFAQLNPDMVFNVEV